MNDLRTEVPAGKDPIRVQIINAVLEHLKAAPFDEDVPDGPLLFDTVMVGILEDIDPRQTPGCAIEEGAEEATQLIYQQIDKKLRLFFNIKVIKVIGLDPTPLINYYFARIVKLFETTDEHFAGLAMDIAEAGNSIQANGSTDPEPGGTIYLDIDYRHARGDWSKE